MSGRPDVLDRNVALRSIAHRQFDVLSRAQLARVGVTPDAVADQIIARRWVEVVPGVLVLHRGPVIQRAREWIAVLAGGRLAALSSWTALALHGLSGWERDGTHVVVSRGRHVPAFPGVVVHESRRHRESDIVVRHDLPTHGVERAAVDTGAWASNARTACGLLAAVVQQRLSTADRLRQVLDAAGAVRHRRQMMAALLDIEGGAQALSEIDLGRLCRRAGLPEPGRQRVRTDAAGRRRYLDAEWWLPCGRRVVLEVDGIHHMVVQQWYDDLFRQAELARPGHDWVIRIPASALRLEPHRVVTVLRRALAAFAP